MPIARIVQGCNVSWRRRAAKQPRYRVDTLAMPTSSDIAGAEAILQPEQFVCSQFVLTEFSKGVLTARLIGPHIGEREAQIIARELNTAIAAANGIHTLVMDMRSVRAMSSLGLGMCIDVRNSAHGRGSRTIMLSLCRELYELLRMMKMDRLYTIVHDKAELKKLLK